MKKVYIGLIIIIFFHIFVLSRLQFTAWPEMFSFPYVIDKGFLIYKDFHHVYQPLLTFILLGVYKLFGYSLITLKFFTYVLIALIDLMIFLNVKKITAKNSLAIFATAIYVLVQPIFDGNMLWFDIAVTLPVLLSIYFIETNLFLTGIFIAISFLIKQQSVLLGLPILIYLLYKKTNPKKIILFFTGCLVPVIITFIFLLKYDIFSDYLFWTFGFPLLELPKIPGYSINPTLHELKYLFILLGALAFGIFLNRKKIKSGLVLLPSCLIFLVLSAFPRFSFFHLQPALSIFILIIGYLMNLEKKYFVLLLIPVLYLWKGVLNVSNWPDRFYSQEEINFSKEVKKISNGQKVYLLGPSSVVYVLADLVPPRPWIENYVWHFEISGLQEKVIEGWQIDPPVYIFWTPPASGEWYQLGTYQPKKIVEYIKDNYIKSNNISGIEVWQKKI